MISSSAVKLFTAAAATLAIISSQVSAMPSSGMAIRAPAPADNADPCAQWCDPWFGITDAQTACSTLVKDSGKNLELCSGCSIAHGGSVDSWAADYYGVNTDAAYSYSTDCKSCYDISVPGINFGAVKQIYLNFVNGNSTSSAKASGSASTISLSGANGASAQASASASTNGNGIAQIEELNDNTTSGASKLSSTSATIVLALVAVFVGASI